MHLCGVSRRRSPDLIGSHNTHLGGDIPRIQGFVGGRNGYAFNLLFALFLTLGDYFFLLLLPAGGFALTLLCK